MAGFQTFGRGRIWTFANNLLIRGVEHEHASARAPLPRTLQVWKDLEEPGSDKLFLAALKERIEQASVSKFEKQLSADEFQALESGGQIFIQAADLYVSSLNRVLNAEGKRTGPKDQFADYFLQKLGLPEGPKGTEKFSDMTIHVSL